MRIPSYLQLYQLGFLSLCLLLLAIPLPQGGGVGLASPLSSVIWLVILTASSFQLIESMQKSSITVCLEDGPLLTATVLFGLGTLWPWESVAEGQLLLVLAASLFVYHSVRQLEHCKIAQFLWVLLIGAMLQAIYSWLLFWGAFAFMDLRSSVLTGGFLQPNVLASFLATALAAIGVLLADTEESLTSKGLWILYGALFLTAVTLLSTGSRTGWAAMALVATLTSFWLNTKSRAIYVIIILASLITVMALQLIIPELGERIASKASIATPRYEIWGVTLSMIMEKPIFGYGFEAFSREYAETVARIVSQGGDANPFHSLDHPHNFILNWWFVGGLGTVGAFAIVAAWHLYALSKIKTRERLFFLALMTPIYLHMQTEFPFRLSPLHLFIVISLVAFLSASAFQSSKQIHMTPWLAKSVSASVRTFTVIAGVFLLLESWNSWHIFRATKLPDQHAADLQKVIFPTASLERYEDAVAIVIMQRARASGNLAYYSYVAEWAEQKVVKTPIPQIYEALIEAKIALSDQASAQSYYQEMIYLFPNTKTHFVLQKK